MLACLLAYIYPLLPLRDSPQAAAHVLYVVRSSIQSASGNVGVDALRHAWRDCAKGSHFNHCSRACVGCSHEVKRVRRPLFFFWQMTGEMTTLQYCTVPPGYLTSPSRANIREKKYIITLADVTVIIHGSFTTYMYLRYLHHLFQND